MDQQKGFLWVNKSATSASLSRSDRSESQQILRFVHQNKSQDATQGRTRRRPARDSLASSAGLILGTDDDSLPDLSRRHTSKSLSPASKGQLRRQSKKVSATLPTTTPFAALDPFESCAITITRQVQVLIHYYWQILATGFIVDKTEVLPARLRPVRRYETVRDQSMIGLLQDKVRVTALLAVMAARMVHLSKIALPQVNPEHFILAAIRTLRRYMAEQAGDNLDTTFTIMHAIHSLALADVYRRRYDDAVIHLKQLKDIVSAAKITSPSHSYVAEAMINIDGLISIETGRSPITVYSFDPGPLPERRSREIEIHLSMAHLTPPVRLAAEFEENPPTPMIFDSIDFLADASTALDFKTGDGLTSALQHGRTIHPILSPIVRDLLEVVQVAKIVWLTAVAKDSDARWMCQRARVLNHRLLSLKSELQSADDPWIQRMEALRIALLLIMIRCTSRVASRAAQVNVQFLKDSLQKQDLDWFMEQDPDNDGTPLSSTEQPEPSHDYLGPGSLQKRLLLFILLTGHFNALMAVDSSQSWFLDRAAYVASHKLGIKRYRELDDLMRSYLYNPVQQAVSIRFVAMHL